MNPFPFATILKLVASFTAQTDADGSDTDKHRQPCAEHQPTTAKTEADYCI